MERNPAQVKFYKSKKWLKCRAAYLAGKFYICERCGRPATIVHHKERVTPENVGDPGVTLNPENLEALCLECHNKEHFGTGCTAPGLRFTDDGELVAVQRPLTTS